MAGLYFDFLESLIFGAGFAPNPNHRDWLAANPAPTGLEWQMQHVDRTLATYSTWLASEGIPAATPWDGVRRAPWDTSLDLPLPPALDGTFTGLATLEQLSTALRDRFAAVAGGAAELSGSIKAPRSPPPPASSAKTWSRSTWSTRSRRPT